MLEQANVEFEFFLVCAVSRSELQRGACFLMAGWLRFCLWVLVFGFMSSCGSLCERFPLDLVQLGSVKGSCGA